MKRASLPLVGGILEFENLVEKGGFPCNGQTPTHFLALGLDDCRLLIVGFELEPRHAWRRVKGLGERVHGFG